MYNHFPDMASLIRVCTEHGMRETGTPTPEAWVHIADPAARLERALDDMYSYYRRNSSVLRSVLRDLGMMIQVGGVEPFLERMGALFGALAAGWPGDGRSQHLRAAAIGHAMAYDTWRSFADNDVADADILALMVQMVTTISPVLTRDA